MIFNIFLKKMILDFNYVSRKIIRSWLAVLSFDIKAQVQKLNLAHFRRRGVNIKTEWCIRRKSGPKDILSPN